jgi:hypothetical protein
MSALQEPEQVVRELGLAPVTSARARLEQLIGREFTERLVVALSPPHGRRGSSSP